MPKLGRGVTPIRAGIAMYLAENYKVMRQRALREWGADADTVPQIRVFNPYDNFDLSPERAPILGIDVNRSSRFDVTGIDQGAFEHRPRYNVRLSMWVYSPETESGESLPNARPSVIRMRDDMVAIVRACIFDRPTFGTKFLNFDKSTYTESYNPAFPAPTKSQRYYAGGQATFDVLSEDWLTDTMLGEAREIIVDVEAVSNELIVAGQTEDPFNLGKIK